MIPNDILIKLGNATPQQLAAVKAALDPETGKVETEDVRTISPTDAAKRLNVSRPSVYKLMKSGALVVVKLPGGTNRVNLASVIAYGTGRRAAVPAAL